MSVRAACVARYALLGVILQACLLALAQSAQIGGKVEDPTGAPIPNARVLLVDLASLQTQTATTDQEGKFSFSKLSSPEYEVFAASQGFVTHTERVQLQSRGNVIVVPGPPSPASVGLIIKLKIAST